MAVPEGLSYTKSHEWMRRDGDTAVVGITHYAQDQLGEVVYVELPEVGDTVEQGAEMGTLESVKAVSEIYSPASGEVIAVNERLTDEPNLVNDDPYGEGWLIKIKVGAVDESKLLDAAGYEQVVAAESH
ncbi:MAG TPA: glycine cleavage system protein GcvH [Acidobacteria bacterium]|nr:glycine cleavage system protein GcvH [Acidobacteriota bacterium]